jgi:hypothetical protein
VYTREDVDVTQKLKGPSLTKGWTAGFALREESPTIVRHLADGCPTCNAGLQALHAASALERFEDALAAGLATASPVQALHSALAGLAARRQPRLL